MSYTARGGRPLGIIPQGNVKQPLVGFEPCILDAQDNLKAYPQSSEIPKCCSCLSQKLTNVKIIIIKKVR